MIESLPDYDLLAPCNDTELYQICRRQELNVHPGASREVMIATILGAQEPHRDAHPIDAWRNGIMDFLIDHREVVLPTLYCPAKSMDPMACYGCPDTQVMSCITACTPADECDIAKRRFTRPQPEKNKDMESTSQTLTIANAPRDEAELKTKGGYKLKQLGLQLTQTVNPSTGAPFLPPINQNTPVRSALLAGKPDEMVPHILGALREYDKVTAGGGAPAAVATPPAAAMAAPAGAAPSIAVPATTPPATGAAPAGAAPAATEPVVRKPRAAAGKAAEGGAAAPAELGEIIKALDNNTAAINALAAGVTKLVARSEADSARIEDLMKVQAAVLKNSTYVLTLLTKIGVRVLQQDEGELGTEVIFMAPNIVEIYEPQSVEEGKAG